MEFDNAGKDVFKPEAPQVDNNESKKERRHEMMQVSAMPPERTQIPYTQHNTVPIQSLGMHSIHLNPQQQMPQYQPYHIPGYSYQHPSPPQQFYQQYPQPYSKSIAENPNLKRTGSWATSTTLAATAGTLLGLSVAATARWLSGDDWYLVASSSRTTALETSDTSAVPPKNCSTVDKLETSLDDHTTKVDNTNHESLQITNQAMEFLRQQRQIDNIASSEKLNSSDVKSSLLRIQQSLLVIQESFTKKPVEESENIDADLRSHLSAVLSKLDGILETYKIEDDTSTHPDVSLFADVVVAKNQNVDLIGDTVPVHDFERINVEAISLSVIPSYSSKAELREALSILARTKHDHTSVQYLAGIQSLYLFASNVSKHPRVPRYRRIYCDNENYRNNVKPINGASEMLSAVGFVQNTPTHQRSRTSKYWEWSDNKDAEAMYLDRLREAVLALGVLKGASDETESDVLLEQAFAAAGLLDDISPTLDNNPYELVKESKAVSYSNLSTQDLSCADNIDGPCMDGDLPRYEADVELAEGMESLQATKRHVVQ